ncbi:MAG: carboxypeptidase-like regulatory domain-containing protein, partial [Gemmatimonadota bacterium]
MKRRRILGVAALLLTWPVSAQAQVVFGHVLDGLSGRPLATTAVMLLDSAGSAVGYVESDSLGRFRFRAPGPGRYQVYLDQLAYEVFMTDMLTLHATDELELLLRMTPVPLELGRVVVSAQRRTARLEKLGFYRRERVTMGHLLGPEEIQERRPHVTTDLFRQIPSVQLRWSPGGYIVTLRRLSTLATSGGCAMK